MAVPATVIYFTTYDQLRDYLHARTGSRGHHIPLLAGALARRECLPQPPAHALLPLRGSDLSFPPCSGCCDVDQPLGADPHQDAIPTAQLPRAARLHPVGGGAGRLAVPLEGMGAHGAAGRPLLWYGCGMGCGGHGR